MYKETISGVDRFLTGGVVVRNFSWFQRATWNDLAAVGCFNLCDPEPTKRVKPTTAYERGLFSCFSLPPPYTRARARNENGVLACTACNTTRVHIRCILYYTNHSAQFYFCHSFSVHICFVRTFVFFLFRFRVPCARPTPLPCTNRSNVLDGRRVTEINRIGPEDLNEEKWTRVIYGT